MMIKLNEKRTLFLGLVITLGITILGGFVLTTFLMQKCKDVIC